MESHRLARLVQIIVEVKARPDRPAHQLARELGISTRQFYYDRNQLARLGFAFSREKGRFMVLDDPVVAIGRLPLSEILALVLATRHLFATRDFSIVKRALAGLYKMIDRLPETQKRLLTSIIQDIVIKDGFGCTPDVLEDITRAVEEKRRILVHFRHAAAQSRTMLDPFALCLRKSKLFLEAYAVEKKRRRRYRVGTMDRIIFTPFYRPEYPREKGKCS